MDQQFRKKKCAFRENVHDRETVKFRACGINKLLSIDLNFLYRLLTTLQ